jgi:hypothetical protein
MIRWFLLLLPFVSSFYSPDIIFLVLIDRLVSNFIHCRSFYTFAPSFCRAIEVGYNFIRNEDPRQAYLIMREVMAHPNATFSQHYRAIEGLAAVMNCSRHVDIPRRSNQDIIRSDSHMEELAWFLLYPMDKQKKCEHSVTDNNT